MLLFNENLDLTDNEKKLFLNVLLKLIVEDRQIEAKESLLMKNIMSAYKIPITMFEEVKSQINDDLPEDMSDMFSNTQKKLELIKAMCLFSASDRVLSDDEKDFLIDITQSLGIDSSKLQEINKLVHYLYALEDKNDVIMGLQDTPDENNEEQGD